MTDSSEERDRVAAVNRGGGPITEQQRADAVALLTDLLATARQHDVTLADFDWVTSLPDACVDVILQRARKRGER